MATRGVWVRRADGQKVHLPGLPALEDLPDLPQQGLCEQVDPELWFPDVGGPVEPAKKICRRCPVRRECLEWALRANEEYGIWGGLTARERRDLRAHHLPFISVPTDRTEEVA